MRHRNQAPRGLPSQGFTLIELMIVIAIIAVLVSLALPSYMDFTIRTKVSEGLSVAGSAKVAVAETCMTENTSVQLLSAIPARSPGLSYVQQT